MQLPNNHLDTLLDLYKIQNFVGAIDYINDLVDSYEKSRCAKHLNDYISACYEQLGKCHMRIGNYRASDKAISKSVQSFPNNSRPRLLQIESLIQRGDIENAGRKLVESDKRFENIALSPYFTELSAILLKIHGDYETSLFFLEISLTQERGNMAYMSANRDIVKNILEKNPDDETAGMVHYVSNMALKTAMGNDKLGLHLAKNFLSTRLKKDSRPEWQDTYHTLLTKIYLADQNIHLCSQHFKKATQNKNIPEISKVAFHASLQQHNFSTANDLLKKYAAAIIGDNGKWTHGFLQKDFSALSDNKDIASSIDNGSTEATQKIFTDKTRAALLTPLRNISL